METIGNGERLSFAAQLEVMGDHALPNVFTTFCLTDFAGLVFSLDNTDLFDFNQADGVFTFKRTGHLQISATLNFGATGISEVQISPLFKRGAGAWTYLNARRSEIPIIGPNSVFMSGSVDIIKSDLMKFEIRATNALAEFDTEVLVNTSVIPAAVLDFKLLIR